MIKKILLLILTTGLSFAASNVSATTAEPVTYGHVDAQGLKAMIDSQIPFVLLDARGQKWNDNNIIPGASLASYEDSYEEISQLISVPESLIVVYCYSATCPLAFRLVQKLIDYGYPNVIEYTAGLKEWRDGFHYPVDTIQNTKDNNFR